MTNKQAYLKVKIKSLAAEAKIIRHEEAKYRYQFKEYTNYKEITIKEPCDTWFGLRQHRKCDVGSEQRAALLAYGFIRGLAYLQVETLPKDILSSGYADARKMWLKNTLKRSVDLIKKYSNNPEHKKITIEDLIAWTEVENLAKAA